MGERSAVHDSTPGEKGRGRVLYLITSDISARFLRGQLAFLIDRGYSIHVGVGFAPDGVDFDAGAEVNGIDFRREPHVVADLRAFVQTVQLIKRLRPDIVNASTPKAGLIGMAAAWICRVERRVHVVRGLRYETMTGWKRTVMSRLEGLSIRLASDVVFNSASLREAAERDGLVAVGRGEVLGGGSGNGVDVHSFHGRFDVAECRKELGVDGDAVVIGCIGRLTADKGIPDLIQAFDLVAADVPAARLVIIGSYEPGSPVPAPVRDRIRTDEAIVHHTWTDAPERVYPAFDVLAIPSLREGLPNVALEAQASGIPVAGYDVTGTHDAVSEEGRHFLVEPGDVRSLADRILELLTGDPSRAGLVDRNREWVTTSFSQQRIWSDLEAIYARNT